jgi:cobalt/nickel transport system permease protein
MRSLERSERIYVAMLARGYDGEIRTLPQAEMETYNWIVLGFGGGIMGLVLILSLLMGA